MSPDYYRNKHLLGELTLGEFMDTIRIEGEYTVGSNWLPITRVRRNRKRGVAGIFMYSSSDGPDITMPLGSKVKLVGNVLEVMAELIDPRYHRVRIRLERVPEVL